MVGHSLIAAFVVQFHMECCIIQHVLNDYTQRILWFTVSYGADKFTKSVPVFMTYQV